MGEILLDSNVIIAYLEPENYHHAVSTAVLLEKDNIYYLSALSISECLMVAFREGYEFAIESLFRIKQLITTVLWLSEEIAISAAQIGAESNLKTADSVILATAKYHALVLWTFDKRLASKSERIRYLLS